MREVLFFEVIEAALLGDEFFYQNAPLAALARVPGVNDVAVDDFDRFLMDSRQRGYDYGKSVDD